MKTNLLYRIFMVIVILISGLAVSAQLTVTVTGTVTDLSNAPAPNYSVNIRTDSIYIPGTGIYMYTNNVLTDVNGNYSDIITLPPGISQLAITAWLYDCNQNYHSAMTFYPNVTPMNFSICTNPAPPPCSAIYYVTPDSSNQLMMHFSDISTGTPTAWSWTFGDGMSSTQQNPTHTYAQSGVYIVCLTITTANCTDSYCDSIIVGNSGPSCYNYFTYSTSGLNVNLIGYAVGFGAISYSWDFGDATSGTGQSTSHTYSSPGNYTVALTTVDAAQCTHITSQIVTVSTPGPCAALFTFQPDSLNPNSIQFYDISVGNPTSWNWTFGDGSSSTLQNPTHSYNSTGYFMVCLTIYDSTCTSTYCDTIYVGYAPPLSCIAYYSYQMVPGSTSIYFQNSSTTTYNPASHTIDYTWSFGDGTSSTAMNPVHTYSTMGTFNVCLTITVTNAATQQVVCTDVWCSNIQLVNNSNGTLYGQLYTGNTAAGSSQVYLIDYNSTTGILTAVDSVQSYDSLGITSYYFAGVPNGTYLLKTALLSVNPNYWNYVPTYYDSSLFWNQGTQLSVNNNVQSFDIHMIAGVNPGGPGFIGGLVSQGANKGPGDPIVGAEVILLDNNNNPVAYTYTTSIGEFTFSNIPYGSYKVYVEMINKTTYPTAVTIDAATPSVGNLAIEVNSTTINTSIQDEIGLNTQVGQVYPNPVKVTATIDINLEENMNILIQIMDMTGKIISNESRDCNAGKASIELDIENLTNGVYYLRLVSPDGGKAIRKIVKL